MKPCEYCGTPFKERTDREHRFCSIACANKSRRVNFPKTCPHCGKQFQPPPNHRKQKYCSTSCRDAARTTRQDVPCAECGTLVVRPDYRIQKLDRSFCGKPCEMTWKKKHAPRGKTHHQYVERVQILCDACGKQIERVPSQISTRNFCNPSCHAEWKRKTGYFAGENSPSWRGGYIDYRGPNWRKQSRAARKRDNDTCQHCGATSDLQVHHLIPYQTFTSHVEANDLVNLLTLCMTCHTTAEWQYRKQHPEDTRLVPDTTRLHTCHRCGNRYIARGANSIWCEDCRHRNCEKCGQVFRIKNINEVNKYCSRVCAGTSK